MMKRIALGMLLAAMAVSGLHAQAQGRIAGKVMDPDGQALQGVTVTVRAVGFNLEIEQTTNKKGKFTITVVDSTKDFTVTLEKEGFRTFTEPVDVPLQGIATKDFTLVPGQTSAPAASAASVGTEGGPPLSKNRAAVNAFNAGATAFNAGDIDTAIAKFNEAVELDPAMTRGWTILAGLYQERQDWPAALDAANQALAVEPDNVIAMTTVFDSQHSQGLLAAEMKTLDQLIAIDPSAQTARRAYNAAVATARAGDGAKAIELFEKAVELDPALIPAHRVLADSYFNAGDLELAKKHIDHVYEIDPTDASGLTLRYEIYHAMGDDVVAKEALDALETASPEALAETYLTQGVEMFENGDTKGALDLFERAVAANPDHPRVNFRLGMAYANTGQNDKAKEHLQRFVELAPDDPEATTATEMMGYL